MTAAHTNIAEELNGENTRLDGETADENNISVENCSTASKKVRNFRANKKLTKIRMTKAKNKLSELIEERPIDFPLSSKNAIRRAMERVTSEMKIISKIIANLKELYAVDENTEQPEEVNDIIESLDKELEDLGNSVDVLIERAEKHLQDRLDSGEEESVFSVEKASNYSYRSKKSSTSHISLDSLQPNNIHESNRTPDPVFIYKQKKDAEHAEDRLREMENEQKEKENQIRRMTAELQLSSQRTEEARKIVEHNCLKAKEAEAWFNKQGTKHNTPEEKPVIYSSSVRLKGVDLPTFTGDGQTEFETWKAAFKVMVDSQNLSDGEKMLRLQSSLSGRALEMVKDLGFTTAAYERAKVKLDARFGGERRQQMKHLTTLRNWQNVRSRNVVELEEFHALLERILINTTDGGSSQDQSLKKCRNLMFRIINTGFLIMFGMIALKHLLTGLNCECRSWRKPEKRLTDRIRGMTKNYDNKVSKRRFQQTELVWLAPVGKIILPGSVISLRSCLYRREKR